MQRAEMLREIRKDVLISILTKSAFSKTGENLHHQAFMERTRFLVSLPVAPEGVSKECCAATMTNALL